MVRQAFSLDVLVNEVNHHARHRSHASDGGIGDVRHQHEVSDHNPNRFGVWRAYDFTNDPKNLPGHDLATRLSRLLGKHPAMVSGAYVIWDHHIISFDHLSEGWRAYTGDPHTSHVHLSVATLPVGYDSRRPWNLFPDSGPHPYERARALVDEAVALIAHQVPPNREAAHAYGTALAHVQASPDFPRK